MDARSILFLALLSGCGGGNSGAQYVGAYSASYAGTWQNTTPNTLAGTYDDTASVTVAEEPNGNLKLTWQVGTNPPSGSIIFALTGSTGTAVQGMGTGGNCFMGKLKDGSTQSSCCDTCSVTFNGLNSFTQQQAGHYDGVTAIGAIPYKGTYNGTWSGNRLTR